MTEAAQQYVLISPCRNEQEFMRQTLDSVIAQSVRPALWVIVDDGSTDDTPQILEKYAAEHRWIRVVTRENRGMRSLGPGVVEAFYAGYDTIDVNRFDYLCKLDLDLDLPERYFERLMERMEAECRIATCSGKPYYPGENGELVSETCGDETSVGASKFYRVSAWKEMGGFVQEVMWDGIDCHRCRMHGWIVCSWDDPEIRFIHLRPTGSSHHGILAGRMRHGTGQYFMGTSLAYMTVSSLYRMTRPPMVIGGLAMWVGFVKSMVGCESQYPDREFRQFLNRYQWSCLIRGKRRATDELNARQEVVWLKTHSRQG